MKRLFLIAFAVLPLTLGSGCATITKVGAQAAAATGVISAQQAESIVKTGEAVAKAAEQITPSQEHYLGRSVAATVLGRYKAYDAAGVNAYINMVGQSLAIYSDKPCTFSGYHFLVMDTDEINAFAAPGGFVLISRGLLRCCPNEDALAAVLAHEIGHVQLGHGISAIKKSRLTAVFTTAAAEAGKSLGGAQLAQLTAALEGSVTDITSTMVDSGYARQSETEADRAAVEILKRTGYNPNGLKEMLEGLEKRTGHSDQPKGFAKTHPDAKVRLKEIEPLLVDFGPVSIPPARDARFKKAMAGI